MFLRILKIYLAHFRGQPRMVGEREAENPRADVEESLGDHDDRRVIGSGT